MGGALTRAAEGMHCNDIPCRHHGVCVATDTSYECKCYKGRHGRNCQYVTNICKESRCKNGGTCVRSNGNSFTCHCKVGFQGVLCEIDIDECASNPCLSGGRCIDEPGAFRCSCPVGFNGSRCENSTTKYKTKENEDTFGTMNWLLIVAVLLLLLSLTLVGAYYYRWSRSRRQKRSGASHTPKGWKVIRGTHLAHKRGSSNKRGKQRKHGGNFISTPRSRWKWLSLDRLKRSVTRAGQTFDHRRIARTARMGVSLDP